MDGFNLSCFQYEGVEVNEEWDYIFKLTFSILQHVVMFLVDDHALEATTEIFSRLGGRGEWRS